MTYTHAADLLSSRARLTPDREAVLEVETGRRYSYRQLNERASKLAHFMQDKLGVQAGDRVSILAHNSVAYLDLVYGLGKIGAIFTPLNWRLVARELAYIVNDSTPSVLIVGPEFVETFNEMRPQIDVPHHVAIDGAEIDGALIYEHEMMVAQPTEPPRPPGLHGDTPYAILYTSGTTGHPKGAIIPHRQVLFNCLNTVASWGITEHDVSPVLTPLFHAGGLFAFMTPILYSGGRILLGRGFDVNESLRLIVAEKCTVILGVPTLFQLWMKSPLFEKADFKHVRFFISGGAPCPPALMEEWRARKNVVFRQGYGLTEVGVNCFSMTDAESVPKTGAVGKPVFHSKMRLVDENGQDVPQGQEGELWIWGPHVCLGYWRNEEATAAALTDGWFHTGDMARMDEDGFYTIIGRAKDMIISGGENIYAAEVEAVFRQHPAVADAALIGEPHEKWGEVGLMIVLLKPGMTAAPEELAAFCGGKLARYKIPKRVIFAEELPYSPYGKVMKNVLRERYVK
ncbi:MAG: long-chain fatty acid--CoA ligase [Anaerolineae bacterium]|nr:long-chain fatty acid--CoA ligase [Anaerolineae bacterium]